MIMESVNLSDLNILKKFTPAEVSRYPVANPTYKLTESCIIKFSNCKIVENTIGLDVQIANKSTKKLHIISARITFTDRAPCDDDQFFIVLMDEQYKLVSFHGCIPMYGVGNITIADERKYIVKDIYDQYKLSLKELLVSYLYQCPQLRQGKERVCNNVICQNSSVIVCTKLIHIMDWFDEPMDHLHIGLFMITHDYDATEYPTKTVEPRGYYAYIFIPIDELSSGTVIDVVSWGKGLYDMDIFYYNENPKEVFTPETEKADITEQINNLNYANDLFNHFFVKQETTPLP